MRTDRVRMRTHRVFAATATALVVAAAPLAAAAATADAGVSATVPPSATVRGTTDLPVTQLIVKYQPGVSPTEAPGVATGDRAVDGVDLEPGRKMSLGLRTVKLSEPLSEGEAAVTAAELTADPRVVNAEPDVRVRPTKDVSAQSATNPNDPIYTSNNMWGLNGTYGINGPAAWAVTTGSPSVVVAVIDTGILSHTDLAGANQVAGYDMIDDALVANDGDGRDADPSDPGDWVTQAESDQQGGWFENCGASDSSWHGTHVRGTINASSDNGQGVASVAPGVKTQAVRALGKCGGSSSDVIDAITWASGGVVPNVPSNATPAEVINMSLGGPGSCDSFTQSAINGAVTRGTTVVVAAGNSNQDASNSTPANCNNVVTVGAIGSNGKRASFSNYGSVVDVSAPGVGIYSTVNAGTTTPTTDDYQSWAGTSMATPHVAGLAALQLSLFPSLAPADVEARLKANSLAFAGGVCDPNPAKAACGVGIATTASVAVGVPAAPTVKVPGSVVGLKATYKRATAKLSWRTPASNGGATVTGYRFRVSKNGGRSWSGWRFTRATKTSLKRARKLSYVIQVAAVNVKGRGPAAKLKLRKY